MTDKQIIIDGVDVRGCPNFTFNKIEPNESICISEQSAMCVNNKDCLYKKWKRKEQECEELKKMNETGLQQWVDMYNKADKERFEALLQRDRYKQALDEIKEICKVNAINTCWTALNLCDKCDEKEECCLQSPLAKLDAISNIINKTKE